MRALDLHLSEYDWKLKTEPNPHMHNRCVPRMPKHTDQLVRHLRPQQMLSGLVLL